MANIQLSGGFTVCPEGRHIFRIYKVDYNKEFGKLAVYMITAKGITHVERFSLMKQSGEMNEGACNAFSFFAKTALRNFSLEEIDHNDLVNHYIGCEIVHTVLPSNADPNKTITFANTSDKWEAEGFDTEPVKRALTIGNESSSNDTVNTTEGVDLDSLLD